MSTTFRFWVGSVSVSVSVSVSLALACGSSRATPEGAGGATLSAGASVGAAAASAGTPGSAGEASGGGGAGAGGSGSVFGDSMAEACVAYALAVCTRRSECSGRTADGCLSAGASCPDLTASPGSTRTVDGLKACAETYKTLPCEQVDAFVVPPCVTPGERAQGEPCVFPSQCSTLNCENSGGCGKCAREAGLGQSCAADDVDCAANAYCGPEQVCVAINDSPGAIPPLPIGPNQPCVLGDSCVEDYFCPGGVGAVCTALPTSGQSCSEVQCASDSYCVEMSAAERVCVAAPALGEPCAVAPFSGIDEPYVCDAGLICSYSSPTAGTCLPLPEAGEPCNIPPSNPSYGRCATGLSCNFGPMPATCGLSEAGEACASSGDCEANLSCSCPANTPDCKSKLCLSLKLGGEPCGADTNSACHAAYDCRAGICQPAALRGVHAEMCGG